MILSECANVFKQIQRIFGKKKFFDEIKYCYLLFENESK